MTQVSLCRRVLYQISCWLRKGLFDKLWRCEIPPSVVDDANATVTEVKASEPTLTTSATKPGLTYTLREGATLGGMTDGATKLGDGSPWTPEITVKGGTSGFYSIKVTK